MSEPRRRPAGARSARERAASVAESARMALHTLRQHKLRSFLTILGIVIGVTAIVGMTSLIRGLDEEIVGEIEEIGADHLFLRKWGGRIISSEREFLRLERRPEITERDVAAIADLPSVRNHDVMLGNEPVPERRSLSYRGNRVELDIVGTSESYPEVFAAEIAEGRFYSPVEVRNANRVVVLGAGVAEELFPHVDPVGKTIRIGEFPYRVTGVFAEEVFLLAGQTEDNRVVIPYTAFHRDFEDDPEMNIMMTIVPRVGAVEEAREEVTWTMRRRHGLRPGEENDFDIVTQESFLELWDQITGSVFLAMIVISSIALMVGGIGVMNIMLVSVTERTREIGVRKAMGARRRDILWQFLVEATTLTAIGGIFGVALGSALGAGVSRLVHFPVSLPVWSFVVGVGFSAAIGIFFGLWPASKAANLDPIEALRRE
ncbi:MAG: ABC transporter permease [Gemmatimonadota bacterium]|nr:ABC transporter permease [Gemmatimonadota bacterium]